MFITPGKPGPFELTALIEGETVPLMKGRDGVPSASLGVMAVTDLPTILKELKASLARPNPLTAKWGMAGAMAYQIAQQAGFKGRPSILADLVDTAGLPPLEFARAFAAAARSEPRVLKMPFSGAFAHLLHAGKGWREAADSIMAVESSVASGFGGKHGAKVLAEIISGHTIGQEVSEKEGSAPVLVINLSTGEITFPPDLPRQAVIRRALDILLQAQAAEESR